MIQDDPSIRVVQDGSHGSIGRAGMSDPSLHLLGGVDLLIHLASQTSTVKTGQDPAGAPNMAVEQHPFIGDFRTYQPQVSYKYL